MNGRTEYQRRRLELLLSRIDVAQSIGLEIGASDLPTVPHNLGRCLYADFRSSREMSEIWKIPEETIPRVDFLLSRRISISDQIFDRFDYVIACHVLEHVPDAISYINDLRSLLKPQPGGVIFLTLPDKRATLDKTRVSTTIERLLAYHHDKITYPLLDHVLEFHRHWVGYGNGDSPLSSREAYEYAVEYLRTGEADVHCHVWRDSEFLTQFTELIKEGFIPDLQIDFFEPLRNGTNEFSIVFKT